MATVKLSAMEWVLRIYSTRKYFPILTISRGRTERNSVRSATAASSNFPCNNAIANRGP